MLFRTLVGLTFSLLIVLFGWSGNGLAEGVSKLEGEQITAKVTVEENLSATLDGQLTFQDHNGQTVSLSDYFIDGKPVLLTLNYYSCETLCSVQLNAMLNALKDLDWVAGDDFRMVTISIDPDETVELAAAKRKTYLEELGKGDIDWNFLVGNQKNIDTVADTIGFRYVYEPKTQQYAHPAVITFLSPDKVVSRYLYGLSYDAQDVKFSLIESANGNVGSTVDKIILSCFIYDTTVGRYTPTAFGIMRLGGALSVFALGFFTLVLWRKEPSHNANRSKA